MKKTFCLTTILCCLFTCSYSQDFQLVYVINGQPSMKEVPNDKALNFTPENNKVLKIIAKTGDLQVFSDARKIDQSWEQTSPSSFEFILLGSAAKTGKRLEVKKPDGTPLLSFVLPGTSSGQGRGQGTTSTRRPVLKPNLRTPHEEAFENAYDGFYTISDNGITIDNRLNGTYEFGGPDFSHIFIDQFGNTIKTTMPQGLADQIYVVHIIYMVPKDQVPDKIYAIRQTRGRFNPALRAETAIVDTFGITQNREDFDFYEKTYSLSKSTEDIEFDLMVTEGDGTRTKIESFKIAMTPGYHWSMHAGLLNSWLSNPAYQLTENPANPSTRVVKRSGAGNRGVVTVFATLYTSPFTLIRHGIQKKKMKKGASVLDMKNPVPKSQKWGKNYLYERHFLDRIYPAIGIGLKDKTFDNLFGGFNIEFARGGYLFAGIHYGKVNFFDNPDDFVFGTTPISEAEFNLRKDEKWRINFAVGVNVDFVILTSLFRP